ncbi:segregation and condensation protein A [Schaalia cardiffensis F0333]|uniref:Segregation and condensation protein A n=1 Tax=Schaalia cardiffensis F0333 TaxID=888050 RepID=N6X249_9ACTO|nr:ScpA family protein [Schaalia cardiffensis]ENO17517.1 segregation and condensation protein A [Schaalia cardiffensis F0333]
MATQPDSDSGSQGVIDDFTVVLDVFEGPFDLLLQLIARKRLDITEVALSEVTDEFLAHMKVFPDLSRTSEFLVVAATLLHMKSVSLLPRTEVDSDISREDLEARDLLFSRLLQYRAFKGASEKIHEALEVNADYIPRQAPLEKHFAALLPELIWTLSPEDLAIAAAHALSSKDPEVVTTHLHDPLVPVREQAILVAERLKTVGALTFHELIADAESARVVVSRFLAVLELYRRHALDVNQDEPLAELELVWTGDEDTVIDIDEADYSGLGFIEGEADDE